MLLAGDDPLYLARRFIRAASEGKRASESARVFVAHLPFLQTLAWRTRMHSRWLWPRLRRAIRLACPNATSICATSVSACKGSMRLLLIVAAAYLANAPKSIHVYTAMKEIRQLIESGSNPMPPIHLCNAPTQLMKVARRSPFPGFVYAPDDDAQTLGYGHDYVYTPQAPSEDEALAQTYLPDIIGERDWLHLDTMVDRMDYGQQWKKTPL